MTKRRAPHASTIRRPATGRTCSPFSCIRWPDCRRLQHLGLWCLCEIQPPSHADAIAAANHVLDPDRYTGDWA